MLYNTFSVEKSQTSKTKIKQEGNKSYYPHMNTVKTLEKYIFVCTCMCYSEGVKSEDSCGVSALLPPCGSQGSNSGCQAWWQMPFSDAEPSLWTCNC